MEDNFCLALGGEPVPSVFTPFGVSSNAPELPAVLRDVSFNLKARERVELLGRTRIIVDDIDIYNYNLIRKEDGLREE